MRSIFTYLMLVGIGLLANKTAFGQVAPSDSMALVELYNSTNGPNWTNHQNWLTGPVYTWYRITIDNFDEVYEITLSGNKLTGTIPTELGQLPALFSLDLSNNQLTGAIPSSFGFLPSIEGINLNGNKLSGSIPDLTGLT